MKRLSDIVLVGLWAVATIAVILQLALLFGGCVRTRVRYVQVPVAEKREPCLTDPQVNVYPWSFTPGSTADAQTDCPEKFEACLGADAVAAIGMTLRALEQRIREDWTLCGPAPPQSEPIPDDAEVTRR